MQTPNDTIASLHAGTPAVAVAGSAGTPVLALRFLRHPDAPAAPARILLSRTVASVPERTGRQYGSRPLKDETGHPLPDATTVTALSGQGIMLHTADGDAAYTLSDVAGRPLWRRSAQGTVSTFAYEPAGTAGRLLTVTEVSTGGSARVRDRLSYVAADDADAKARNLAGTAAVHRDNAGLTETLSVALTGQPLKSEQRLLPADAPEPDWSAVSQPGTEAPLTVSGTYDATGAPLLQTNAAGVTTLTAYDINGSVRETRVRYTPKSGAPAEEVVTLRDILYRADGVVLSQTAGNGITEEYEYDARTQYLTRHSVRRPASHPAGALLLSDLHYGYDPAGNILTLEDKGTDPVWHNNQQATGLRTYGYDTLYRLAFATGRERVMRAQRRGPLPREHIDPSAGSAWSPYEETYQYDDGDNLIKQTHTGGSGWTRTTAVSSRSNRGVAQESGQPPAADPHDAYLAGGLRKALDDGRLLAWYADGQLSHVTPVSRVADEQDDAESYRYGDPGTRVRKVRVTKVAAGTQTAVTTYAGGCEMRSRVLGNSVQLDIRVTEAGGVRVIHDGLKGEVHLRYGFADHLGSVSGEMDSDGHVTSREEYYPYGGSAGADEEAEETADRTRRYSGKERDATGLLYYSWRYYQAESGRWLSADPGGLIDGVNLYRMCLNNPINYHDADGLMPKRSMPQNSKEPAKRSQPSSGSLGSLFDDIGIPSSSENSGSLFSSIPSASKGSAAVEDEGMFSGAVFGALLSVKGTPEENHAFNILQNAFPNMTSVETKNFIGRQKIDTAPGSQKLTPLEYSSLRVYMADNIYHEVINSNEDNGRNNGKVNIVADATASSLKKAEKFNGLAFRGKKGWGFNKKEGDIFVSNFMSTSKLPGIVTSFMEKIRGVDENTQQTRFVISGESSAVLSSVIKENLDEVLFPAGTEFDVIFRHQPESGEPPILRVVMEERNKSGRKGQVKRQFDALDLNMNHSKSNYVRRHSI